MLSHETAGVAWKLLSDTPEIHVTVWFGRGSRGCRPGVRIHRSRVLTTQDRTVIGHLPVTTPARTLVDLASCLKGEALARVVEDAFCRQLVTPTRVAAALDRCARRGRTGCTALRDVLTPWLDGRSVDSVAEGAFRRAIAAAGLPPPVAQYKIEIDGKPAYLDFAWPERRVALEVESYRWHSGPKSFSRDMARANRLAALGWRPLRATLTELETQGGGVIAALSQYLGAPA